MLWILPLEPLEERYTKQWNEWFIQYVNEHQLVACVIEGKILTHSVETGLVLDAAGTNYWKTTQMTRVAKLFHNHTIKDGDKFFTMDLWHPGLEAIPYMAELFGIRVEVYGFLHAGSYTAHDFAEPMARWAYHFERGWASICTKVFFGSQYHMSDFQSKRGGMAEHHGVVTGCPFRSEALSGGRPVGERSNMIVFPHRWDEEKRPDIFVAVLNRLYDIRTDFLAVITTGRKALTDSKNLLRTAKFAYSVQPGMSKHAYYETLRRSKIVFSCAEAEYFGYGVTESVAAGCHPVVPDRLSYPELIPDYGRYQTQDEAVIMLNKALNDPQSVQAEQLAYYDGALGRIFEAMGL